MSRSLATGIDIGTYEVKVVIAEEIREENRSTQRIIGTGISESKGLHHGYITNKDDVARAISEAANLASKAAGVPIKRAFVSVGGIGLSGVISTGSVIISRADLEVTDMDISKALEAAEAAIPHAISLNRKVINTIPIEYKIDGKLVWGRVEGLHANKLEVKALFVTCLEHHLEDIINSVECADIEVVDVCPAPIAASLVTLSKKEKKAGCVLANIGAETLSIVVFENNNPVSLEVFPIGGTDITNDIALGLKIPLDEAESIKLGSVTGASYSKKKLEEIVSARLSDMFELIEAHLRKIGRNALLPAGIILTGGSSGLSSVKDLAENALKLPSKIAEVHFGTEAKAKMKDSTWAVAYGLAILGFNADNRDTTLGPKSIDHMRETNKKLFRTLSKWMAKFLP